MDFKTRLFQTVFYFKRSIDTGKIWLFVKIVLQMQKTGIYRLISVLNMNFIRKFMCNIK
jgi:hypothetical protein